MLASLTPVAAALVAIPVVFVAVPVGAVVFVVVSLALGALISRVAPAGATTMS